MPDEIDTCYMCGMPRDGVSRAYEIPGANDPSLAGIPTLDGLRSDQPGPALPKRDKPSPQASPGQPTMHLAGAPSVGSDPSTAGQPGQTASMGMPATDANGGIPGADGIRHMGASAPVPVPVAPQATPVPRMPAAAPCDGGTGRLTDLVLTNMRTRQEVVVDRDFGIIGRDGDFSPDAFDGTVSRQHLVVSCKEGRWSIRHMGTNDTVVFADQGGFSLPPNMEYPLEDGNSLKIAQMYFDVSVRPRGSMGAPATAGAGTGSQVDRPSDDGGRVPVIADAPVVPSDVPTVSGGAATGQMAPDMLQGWFVDCPVCGTAIPVDGATSRVSFCPHCSDPVDRRRVARLSPEYGVRSRGRVSHEDR